jgi:hypothetical protein
MPLRKRSSEPAPRHRSPGRRRRASASAADPAFMRSRSAFAEALGEERKLEPASGQSGRDEELRR